VSSKDKQAPFPAFGGVGLEFAVTDGLVTILTAYDSAPAAKAGLIAGDVISDVDDVSVKGLSLDQVIGKLRGPPGTQVRLRIVRKGQDNPIDFTIVRELIRLPGAQIEVRLRNGELVIAATGPWSVLDFEKDKPIAVRAISGGEFRVDSGDHTRIAFVNDAAGKVSGVVLNPGPWEIRAAKLN
jgi:C-terminal processing protease CtpA/Prc